MGASEDDREGGLFQGIKVNSKSPGLHNIAQWNGVPHTVSHTQIVIPPARLDWSTFKVFGISFYKNVFGNLLGL